MPNRLANETSPYLLQHANNPVDWYPWCDDALARSRGDGLPIFLSIGYSACHWCHVMEHESFEDQQIADQLNADFVCIKVDREERPDLDQIYMQAVQMLTGRGGWPMSVFLTPELQPFFGGTYWPPRRSRGMPGFDDVLRAVLDAWQNRREQAVQQAEKLTTRIQDNALLGTTGVVDLSLLQQATRDISSQFDFTHGGFGQAPKFPHSMIIQFLIRMWHREPERNADLLQLARRNLERMAAGGIYDHLGGGFARYSVDERWLVPHFEKMLYDNALLTDAYLDLLITTGESEYGQVAAEVCNYVLNYMTDAAGGFFSTEDADSEGEEGKFYVWTPEQIRDALQDDELTERFCFVYEVSEHGNFEGNNILNLPKTLAQCATLKGWDANQLAAQMLTARQRLLAARDKRPRPARDDKVLTSWNGLMIHSMARAGSLLDNPRFLKAASSAADFVLQKMRIEGRLLHSWRQGEAKVNGFLDDYANLANGLVTLYEATFEDRWIEQAVSLGETMLDQFLDSEHGGFFYTASDHETLIARVKDAQDSSIPSASAMAATVMLRLSQLCCRDDFANAAQRTIENAASMMSQYPLAAGQLLIAADFLLGPNKQIVLAQPAQSAQPAAETDGGVARLLRQRYLPRAVLAGPSLSPHLQDLVQGKGGEETTTLYVCENFTCKQPAKGEQIKAAITLLR